MNYIKHLTGFFDRIVQDRSLNPTHISLYISLFQFWNVNRFQNPISITRDEVMRISKICSKATYHKCMRELNEKGYIKYEPSFNPFKGSMVILFNFSEDLKPVQKRVSNTEKNLSNSGQLVNKSCTSSGTGTEQALVPSINYINNTNISNKKNVSNLDKQAKKIIAKNEVILEEEFLKNKAVVEKKEEKSSAKKEEKLHPTIDKVNSYFQQQNFPELEANKFFNYFSSNGWLVGGKTPMVDWQAAAKNWMLNSKNFNHNTDTTPTHRAKQLNTGTDKDYSEPL